MGDPLGSAAEQKWVYDNKYVDGGYWTSTDQPGLRWSSTLQNWVTQAHPGDLAPQTGGGSTNPTNIYVTNNPGELYQEVTSDGTDGYPAGTVYQVNQVTGAHTIKYRPSSPSSLWNDVNSDGYDDQTGLPAGVANIGGKFYFQGKRVNADGSLMTPAQLAEEEGPDKLASTWTGYGPKGQGTYRLDGPGGTPGTFIGRTIAPETSGSTYQPGAKAPSGSSGGGSSGGGGSSSSSYRSGGYANSDVNTTIHEGGFTNTNISDIGPGQKGENAADRAARAAEFAATYGLQAQKAKADAAETYARNLMTYDPNAFQAWLRESGGGALQNAIGSGTDALSSNAIQAGADALSALRGYGSAGGGGGGGDTLPTGGLGGGGTGGGTAPGGNSGGAPGADPSKPATPAEPVPVDPYAQYGEPPAGYASWADYVAAVAPSDGRGGTAPSLFNYAGVAAWQRDNPNYRVPDGGMYAIQPGAFGGNAGAAAAHAGMLEGMGPREDPFNPAPVRVAAPEAPTAQGAGNRGQDWGQGQQFGGGSGGFGFINEGNPNMVYDPRTGRALGSQGANGQWLMPGQQQAPAASPAAQSPAQTAGGQWVRPSPGTAAINTNQSSITGTGVAWNPTAPLNPRGYGGGDPNALYDPQTGSYTRAMANGGMTRDPQMIVGDPQMDGGPNPEMIMNPTGAPIGVVPMRNMQNGMQPEQMMQMMRMMQGNGGMQLPRGGLPMYAYGTDGPALDMPSPRELLYSKAPKMPTVSGQTGSEGGTAAAQKPLAPPKQPTVTTTYGGMTTGATTQGVPGFAPSGGPGTYTPRNPLPGGVPPRRVDPDAPQTGGGYPPYNGGISTSPGPLGPGMPGNPAGGVPQTGGWYPPYNGGVSTSPGPLGPGMPGNPAGGGGIASPVIGTPGGPIMYDQTTAGGAPQTGGGLPPYLPGGIASNPIGSPGGPGWVDQTTAGGGGNTGIMPGGPGTYTPRNPLPGGIPRRRVDGGGDAGPPKPNGYGDDMRFPSNGGGDAGPVRGGGAPPLPRDGGWDKDAPYRNGGGVSTSPGPLGPGMPGNPAGGGGVNIGADGRPQAAPNPNALPTGGLGGQPAQAPQTPPAGLTPAQEVEWLRRNAQYPNMDNPNWFMNTDYWNSDPVTQKLYGSGLQLQKGIPEEVLRAMAERYRLQGRGRSGMQVGY